MKKITFLLASLALFAVVDLSAQTVGEVNTKFNDAAALIQAKNYTQAIPVLEATVEMGLNAGEEASATVMQAQKLLPVCYFQSGLAMCRENRFDEALPLLEKALQYGELYQDVKTVGNAKKLMSQTYMAMGAGAFNNKEWAKAIEVFSKGYAANPTDTDLGLYLAESYAESGDYESGLKVYHDIVALEARNSRYQEAAAKAKAKIVYYQTIRAVDAATAGNAPLVYSITEDILSVEPVNPEANLLRIQTATNNKEWARVIEWGNAAAEAQSDANLKSSIYYMLGAAYQNSENKDAAIANYRKVTSGNNLADAKKQIELLSK